ncbi:MAG: hypothetical protein AAFR14_01475, partial [Bacteroidota bacterium]
MTYRLSGIILSILTLCTSVIAQSDSWSLRLKDKIQKALSDTYETAETIDMSLIETDIPGGEKRNGELYQLNAANMLVGYAFVGIAPSMKNVFDYIVMLEPDWTIRKCKVLIYREQHGRQIGSRRWLKQFDGRSPGQKLILGEEIDGIS